MIPLAYTIGLTYGITNEAVLGACFLPVGLGNIVGGAIAGRISDATVRAWRTKRKGEWVPEDRLRAMLVSSAVLVPLSVLGSGALTQFTSGRLGLAGNLMCVFFNGVGVSGIGFAALLDGKLISFAVDVGLDNHVRVCCGHSARTQR